MPGGFRVVDQPPSGELTADHDSVAVFDYHAAFNMKQGAATRCSTRRAGVSAVGSHCAESVSCR